jgi:hypothetical protein
MTKLFIDVNGTITTYLNAKHGEDTFKEGLEEFFNWATKQFDCYWLSNLIPRGMMFGFKRETLPLLPEAAKSVKPAYFENLKTEAIKDGDFFWLDDNLLQEEKAYLEERGWLDGYIPADRNGASMVSLMAEIKKRMRRPNTGSTEVAGDIGQA